MANDLGEFLRSRRAVVQPRDVGLPATKRRRTPGLRREEVAMLAGVSVSWYTWLEQGRDIAASRDVLEAVARTLRLTDAERRHLLTLAERSNDPTIALDAAPDSLVRLINALNPAPAYVLGPRWDYLAWNDAQRRLFPSIDELPVRNLLWAIFAEPSVRALSVDWETEARLHLAQFRVETARVHDDPQWIALVRQLNDASVEFAAWWRAIDVAGFTTRLRRFNHPRAGELVFECQQLVSAEWPSLRVVVLLPVPGDDSAARLAAWHDV